MTAIALFSDLDFVDNEINITSAQIAEVTAGSSPYKVPVLVVLNAYLATIDAIQAALVADLAALLSTGGGGIAGTIANQQVAFGNTATNTIQGNDNLTFDGSNLALTSGALHLGLGPVYFGANFTALHVAEENLQFFGSGTGSNPGYIGLNMDDSINGLTIVYGEVGNAHYWQTGSAAAGAWASDYGFHISYLGTDQLVIAIDGGVTLAGPKLDLPGTFSVHADGTLMLIIDQAGNNLTTTANVVVQGAGTISCANDIETAGKFVMEDETEPLMSSRFNPWTDHSAAAAGTLTNAPVAGNPTKWVRFNDDGVDRFVPMW